MKKINTDVLIVGAGPVGLFTVFELGQLGMKCCVVDSLQEIGGQCTALYPDKPIYDIPAFSSITANQLIKNIKKQIDPFDPVILTNQKVETLEKYDGIFEVTTSNKNLIRSKCIIIAAGNGAFGPNKPHFKTLNLMKIKQCFITLKTNPFSRKKKLQ